MKKILLKAGYKTLWFCLLPIAAFAFFMSMVSNGIEDIYDRIDRELKKL